MRRHTYAPIPTVSGVIFSFRGSRLPQQMTYLSVGGWWVGRTLWFLCVLKLALPEMEKMLGG